MCQNRIHRFISVMPNRFQYSKVNHCNKHEQRNYSKNDLFSLFHLSPILIQHKAHVELPYFISDSQSKKRLINRPVSIRLPAPKHSAREHTKISKKTLSNDLNVFQNRLIFNFHPVSCRTIGCFVQEGCGIIYIFIGQILSNRLHLSHRIICTRTITPMRQLIDQIYIFLLTNLRINWIGTTAIKAMTRHTRRNLTLHPIANNNLTFVGLSYRFTVGFKRAEIRKVSSPWEAVLICSQIPPVLNTQSFCNTIHLIHGQIFTLIFCVIGQLLDDEYISNISKPG